MIIIFKISAVILLGVAAFFLWRNNIDAVVVSAVAGSVSFFLGIRFEIAERNRKRREARNGE